MMTEDARQERTTPTAIRPVLIVAILVTLLTAVTLMPVLAGEAAEAPTGDPSPSSVGATAPDPDFSTIDDPLNGDYELFTVDDLVVARTKPTNNNTSSSVRNYVLETANEAISSQAVSVVANPNCWPTSGSQPQQTRIGRFFSLPYDVIMTLSPSPSATGTGCSGSNNMSLHIQSTNFADNVTTTFTMAAARTAVAMDDFDQDGFEDLLLLSNTGILVATAADVNDPDAGMTVGPPTLLPTAADATLYDPSSGDFNGDGLLDVAWIGQDYVVRFATVCPGSVQGTVCAGQSALAVVLNPANAGATGIDLDADEGNCTQQGNLNRTPKPVALTAGNYTSSDSDDLLTVRLVQTGTDVIIPGVVELPICGYLTHWYKLDGAFSVTSEKSATLLDNNTLYGYENDGGNATGFVLYPVNSYAQSARMNWFDSLEQAVVVIGAGAGGTSSPTQAMSQVSIVSVGSNEISVSSKYTDYAGANTTVNGVATGRFSSVSDNPTSETEFNQQVAVLTNDGKVTVYGVTNPPVDNSLVLLATSSIDSGLGLNERAPGETTFRSWLVAGDLQGRSARLGPPSVFRIASHSQPSVILGAPPMHVDYIQLDQDGPWDIVNFSAVPDTFNSSYSMSQTSTTQSADTSKTSYTYTTAENSTSSFSLKPPYVPSISGSLKKTTSDKSEKVSEDYSFAQDEFVYDASVTTGFGDEIWYDESAFNMYLYRVLGQSVCPNDIPNCTANQEVPLYVMFSGPNSTGTGPAPGETTEWYQPVHEPGNLFSYPWNQTMLTQQIEGGIDLLTGSQHFVTDDSTQSFSLTWSSGSGQSQTAGTTNNHSYQKAYSLTAGKVIGKVADASLKGDLDYSDSSSSSTLNKSSSSLGSSQGIEIDKPGTFRTPSLFEYRVEPYIFGRPAPTGTVDSALLTEDIQTYGPIQAAFAVNPLASGVGSWWGSDASPYTQFIDVALNHPVRWKKTSPTGTQDSLNCLEAGGRNNCMVLYPPDSTPSNLWNSQFYWMRGLFVTVNGVDGPQRNQATAGDTLTLQARVYNYSFMDMPAGSTVKVGFYRQEMSGTTPVDNMLPISTVSTGPLPGFNSANSPNTPNWKLVTTSLDTTGLDNTYWIFWVLVWAEDSSGNMITELPGHGLEMVPDSPATIGDVNLESFSNNVGYLHSKFYVAPATLGAPPPGDLVLDIQNTQVTPPVSSPGGLVIVSTDILAEGAAADGVHVQLFPDAFAWQAYQDDPSAAPPRPFDVELLPHIGAGESDHAEVPYTPQLCGVQTILVVAEAGGETATDTVTLDNGPCRVYFPLMPIRSQE